MMMGIKSGFVASSIFSMRRGGGHDMCLAKPSQGTVRGSVTESNTTAAEESRRQETGEERERKKERKEKREKRKPEYVGTP